MAQHVVELHLPGGVVAQDDVPQAVAHKDYIGHTVHKFCEGIIIAGYHADDLFTLQGFKLLGGAECHLAG